MKPETPDDRDPRLGPLLQEWKLDSALSPRFEERVWQRIERGAARETAASAPGWNWIASLVRRPAFAYSYVLALLIVGMMAGLWQARAASQKTSATLGVRYVQMMDPYQMPRH